MAGTTKGWAPRSRRCSTAARRMATMLVMPRLPAVTATLCPGRSVRSNCKRRSSAWTAAGTSASRGPSKIWRTRKICGNIGIKGNRAVLVLRSSVSVARGWVPLLACPAVPMRRSTTLLGKPAVAPGEAPPDSLELPYQRPQPFVKRAQGASAARQRIATCFYAGRNGLVRENRLTGDDFRQSADGRKAGVRWRRLVATIAKGAGPV